MSDRAPWPLIIVDFDGVLVTGRSSNPVGMFDHNASWRVNARRFDPGCIEALNQIVAATDAMVVVSSTWRHFYTLRDLQNMVSRAGLTADVVGVTPLHEGERWECIDACLEVLEPASYIVLEDQEDMKHHGPRTIWTGWEQGLTQAHVAEAIALLGAS